MELRSLRYFVTLSEELHFGRAAARLHISPPPLTQHIKKLEADLGVELFDRDKRSVKLTNAGLKLCAEARHILSQIDDMRMTARHAQAGETGRLRVGFMSSAPFARSAELYKHLTVGLAGVHLTWHGLTTSSQLRALELQQIDIGILHAPISHPTLEFLPLISDKLVIAVHVSHPLAGLRTSALTAFAQDGFILPPRENSPALYDAVIATCNGAGFNPSVPHSAHDFLAIIGLVSIGAGVALVPPWLGKGEFPNVKFIRIRGAASKVSLAVGWNPDNHSALIERVLSAFGTAGRLD